jgi:hypothetical protein
MSSALRILNDPTASTGQGDPDADSKLRIVAWPDPLIDALGHDPRSRHVEQFWLSVLGPTSTWLMRRLAAGLDTEPGGFELSVCETARALGLGGRGGRHSPFQRAIARCVTFELARHEGPGTLAVRRKVPPLPRRHLLRLPESLQQMHRDWSSSKLRDSRVARGGAESGPPGRFGRRPGITSRPSPGIATCRNTKVIIASSA